MLKDATSSSHIQGLTLAGAFVDEAVVSDRDGFNQLLGRCSVDKSKIWVSCNPESPYHWFYTDFIKQAKKKNILYVHFTMDDNPSLSEEIKKEYKRMFSGVWAERFVSGKWVVARGLIYDMFNDFHILRWEDIPYQDADKWCVGIDYGTANATCFLLGFKDFEGNIYVINEYFHEGGRLAQGESSEDDILGYENQKTDAEYASDLKQFLIYNYELTGLGYRNIEIVCDPAAASFILHLRKSRFRVKQGDNAVLDGIRTVSTYFGSNKLFISEKCKNLIEELHNYSWDEKAQAKGVDAPKKESDHAVDSLRYLVMRLKHRKELSRAAINVGYW